MVNSIGNFRNVHYSISIIIMRCLVLFLLFLVSVFSAKAQVYEDNWSSLDKRPMPEWFNEAKFGIFIHWGVYSVPAYRPVSKERFASYAEWYQVDVMNKAGAGRDFHNRVFGENFEYRQFGSMFKAELFNPDDWADLFVKSGAKYVVLTSKHHDGFCLWPTKNRYSKNWNSMEMGPKRDLLGELTTAVRKKGLRMGLYYSLLEWETPTPAKIDSPYLPKNIISKYQIPRDSFITAHIIPQLKELVNQYQPALIFSDGAWDEYSSYWNSTSFLSWLYNNAPNKDEVIVNDRWGKDTHSKHGDYYSSEYAPEQDKFNNDMKHPWEESQGIGGSYGYNRAENLGDYKSSGQIIHLLIDQVSRGGNLLLNVGPSADGLIPVIMQQRLTDIGKWLAVNGEAIYGTSAWDMRPVHGKQDPVYYTKKGDVLYAICTQWPFKPVVVPGITKAGKISLLGSNVSVKFQSGKNGLKIIPPSINAEIMQNEHAWVFKIDIATL